MSWTERRIYKAFVKFQSLFSSKVFIIGPPPQHIEAHIHTLHRVKNSEAITGRINTIILSVVKNK